MDNLLPFIIESLKNNIPDIEVRSIYETALPKYPQVTVMIMDNREAVKYTTIDTVERASNISVQIDVYARDMMIEGVPSLAYMIVDDYRGKVDSVMQSICGMRRTALVPQIPHSTDNTVMRGTMRYASIYDIDHEIIHKG